MKNVSKIKDCFGCGVCSKVCGKKIIDIKLNSNGFYEPIITDFSKCTGCGLCLDVCAFHHAELSINSEPLKCFAAWSKESAVQRKCSSGGVGFEVGRYLIGEGFSVCGVRYNADKNRAEHYIASSVEELIQSIGSKYIQSYTLDGFRDINSKDKYIVTGTPCQIDSFRRFIQKKKIEENFVLLDFFCHSIPSMWVWKYYLQQVEKKVGQVTYASWRNKQTGWHDSWSMGLDGEKCGEKVDWHESYNMLIRERKSFINSRWSQGDLFYRLFLGDFCCNPACRKNCKYKYSASAADIRIGDLWGETYKNNDKGVSAFVCFTNKGVAVAHALHESCVLIEHPFELVAKGQMKKNAGKAYLSFVAWRMIRSKRSFSPILWKLLFVLERGCRIPRRLIKRLFNISMK